MLQLVHDLLRCGRQNSVTVGLVDARCDTAVDQCRKLTQCPGSDEHVSADEAKRTRSDAISTPRSLTRSLDFISHRRQAGGRDRSLKVNSGYALNRSIGPTSSVLSVLSLRRLADIQWPTSVIHPSSWQTMLSTLVCAHTRVSAAFNLRFIEHISCSSSDCFTSESCRRSAVWRHLDSFDLDYQHVGLLLFLRFIVAINHWAPRTDGLWPVDHAYGMLT